MHGPAILVRTISVPTAKGKLQRMWQYHSRSDHHSKVACWGILYDLIDQSALLREHIRSGRIAFGVNHEMRDFRTGRKKKLDLVIASPGGESRRKHSFEGLAAKWNIQLTSSERERLSEFPELFEKAVGSVYIALEAKAAMTEHGKAESRLYDELNSSHDAVHGAAEMAIAAGFVMVNSADEFISPGRGTYVEPVVTVHDQPRVAESLIRKVHEIPRRVTTTAIGFDALAVVVVDGRNDQSPVRLVDMRPAPQPGEPTHYDSMIRRIIQLYEARFPHS